MQCNWPLGNGESLGFTIYGSNTTWNSVSGLYIFAYAKDATHWHPVYIGQTDNFSNRLPSHDRWDEATRLGATHVHALVVPLAANRDKFEKMLIQNLQPKLNDQHR